jgi:hypothetical protein
MWQLKQNAVRREWSVLVIITSLSCLLTAFGEVEEYRTECRRRVSSKIAPKALKIIFGRGRSY